MSEEVVLKKGSKIMNLLRKTKNLYNHIFDSYKLTFFLLLGILIITSALILIIFNFGINTFYNCNSDDVVQYYPYVDGFFRKIKSGSLSLYDTSLLGGASAFSGAYYIPIDIFLFIAFLFSFVMETEYAYWFSLIVKVCCGAMILFYVFKRKGLSTKACLLSSLIYASCGLLECYVIFPVYLGIIVYAPLGMLLVDLFFDNRHKNKALMFIPIYVTTIVLFDYYIAYMLLAFVSIYYLIESTLRYKKFLMNKKFWLDFLLFMSFIMLGVLMSLLILIPSALYILNQSSRTTVEFDYFWIFTAGSHKSIVDGISWRHYFTQLMNLFIPNSPTELCLVSAGDYMREHASLYMTCGGLIYFVSFFFLKGDKNNKLKIWVLIINLMFMIPLFNEIFSLQKVAYVRWFFIPYTINLYATAIAMSNGFNFDKKKISNYFPLFIILLGIVLVSFVLINNPEIFIHYDKEASQSYKRVYFYVILIGSLVFLCIYFIALLVPHIIKLFNNNYVQKRTIISKVIGLELIFSLVVCLMNVGSISYSNNYTYRASKLVDYLKDNSSYDESQLERINLFTDEKFQANANIMYQNVNPYNFFQSFYNTPLNDYYNYIHNQSGDSWSRRSMYGYSLLNGPMMNIKYVIAIDSINAYITSKEKTDIVEALYLPSKYYSKKDAKVAYNQTTHFYELKESYPFIVYDTITYKDKQNITNNNSFFNDLALLNYGYVTTPNQIYYSFSAYQDLSSIVSNNSNLSNYNKHEIDLMNNIDIISKSNISEKTMSNVYKEIEDSNDLTSLQISTATYLIDGASYFEYNLDNINKAYYESLFSKDAIYIQPLSEDCAEKTFSPSSRAYMYIRDKDTKKLYPFHYNVAYISDLGITPDRIYITTDNAYNTKTIKAYAFNYSLYDEYLENQRKYQDRTFNFDGSNVELSFKNDGKTKIVKLPLTYSNEWKPTDARYQIVNIDAGFLGVIVPNNTYDVSIRLEFSPEGFKTCLSISAIGVIIYTCITSTLVLIDVREKTKERYL